MVMPAVRESRGVQAVIKLNLGAGKSVIEGYTPIDRKFGTEVFPLKEYADNSVDIVRASHVLEHFPKSQTYPVIKEWVRVLKPGGVLKIAVPDFEYACAHADHPHFEGWLMGGQTDDNDYHHALFTRAKLKALLEIAGLESVTAWESEIEDCAALPVSLNLQGTKPKPKTLRVPKMACALSLPRLGFNDSWGCITAALAPWAMPIRRYTSVWWERSLQSTLEDLIAEGFELAVIADYDSMFTAPQFNSLLDAMIRNPHMDAVCALQAQRGSGIAMCTPTNRKAPGVADVKMNEPLQVDTGHFGLTVIRLEKLKQIRKPWFLNLPGEGGSWRREAEGLVDADIHFWNQWKKAGNTLFMLPWVSIGHIEMLVARIDPATGETVHHYPADWIQDKFGVKVKRNNSNE